MDLGSVFGIILLLFALFFGVVVLAVLLRAFWRVPGASEALVITGAGASLSKEVRAQMLAEGEIKPGEVPEFKIVVGRGALIKPGIQRMARLSLAAEEAIVAIEGVTQQGVPLKVQAVVLYKVGDNPLSIAKAARRFDDRGQMTQMIKNVLEGHLRAVVGTMTVEDIMRNREQLANSVRAAVSDDVYKLGLDIDSFQIQQIDDPTGYIKNLGAMDTARVEKEARIARADADREAAQREAEAMAAKAEAEAVSAIKQAEARAQSERATAIAAQAGPLSQAESRQAVVVQETRIAELEAELADKRLESDVRKPADAEAYRQRTLAIAARDAAISQAEAEAASTRQRGEAEAESAKAQGLSRAEVTRQQGLAEAEAVKAQAEALATNQQAVLTKAMVEQMPEVVRAAAGAFDNVDQFTVLNGAVGVQNAFMEAISMGISTLPAVMGMLNGATGNGDGNGGGGGERSPVSPFSGGSDSSAREPVGAGSSGTSGGASGSSRTTGGSSGARASAGGNGGRGAPFAPPPTLTSDAARDTFASVMSASSDAAAAQGAKVREHAEAVERRADEALQTAEERSREAVDALSNTYDAAPDLVEREAQDIQDANREFDPSERLQGLVR